MEAEQVAFREAVQFVGLGLGFVGMIIGLLASETREAMVKQAFYGWVIGGLVGTVGTLVVGAVT